MHSQPDFHVIALNKIDLKTRNYRKRKQHTKTRSGCFTCRVKRVKCDEAKPTCTKCRRNSRSCLYDQPSKREKLAPSSTALASWGCAGDFSLLSAVTLEPDPLPSALNGTSNINLIQHFYMHWEDMFHMPGRYEILNLSKSEPLVRNVVLAIAACHLRHLSPGVLQHRIAEHFQQSLVLENYQKTIDIPLNQLGQSGVNVLLLVGSLLNILAFALPPAEVSTCGEPNYSTSWIFSTRDDRLAWLDLQTGLRSLIRSTAAYLEGALDFIGPLFLGPDKEGWPFGGVKLGTKTIPATWAKIFDLEDQMQRSNQETIKTQPSNVFRQPIMVLVALRDLEPVPSNLFRNLQFLGKVQHSLFTSLYEMDHRALWVLGYWLGLLCRYGGIWWCGQRVTRDYTAICIWLEQLQLPKRPGTEGVLWETMMEELKMAPVYSGSY